MSLMYEHTSFFYNIVLSEWVLYYPLLFLSFMNHFITKNNTKRFGSYLASSVVSLINVLLLKCLKLPELLLPI